MGLILEWEGGGAGFFIALMITIIIYIVARPGKIDQFYSYEPIHLQTIEGKKFIKQNEGWVIRYNDQIKIIGSDALEIKSSKDSSYTQMVYFNKVRNWTPARRAWTGGDG